MKRIYSILAAMILATTASAQIGAPYIHDPSTIAECEGKYYTFGTGGGGLISEDGWTWNGGAERPGGGAAPDMIKIGDRYLCIYGATGGDQDAIDPGIMLDPTTGRLWVSYGTYFGTIRLIELDPKTGFRKSGNKEKDIAIDCEASDLIYRNGWYYLLGTHGTCCDGVNSTYNIVVGRSKSVEGPYIDNVGRDMYHGGGKMVVAAGDRKTGAGHFGRTIIDEGVEVTSFHWEADFDMGGRSTLAIRPLLWKNDWPVAGEQFKGGVFEIESERRGYALELAVDFVRMKQERQGWFNREQMQQPVKPVPNQTLEEVISTWPEGNIPARIGDYMFRPHQRWNVSPVAEAGGYLGGPYFKITIEGTDRALAATSDLEVTTVPSFTGAPEQLWRIEQLIDGTFRIMPKVIPGQEGINKHIVLYSAGDSTPTLAEYDFKSDNSKWNFRNH